MADEKTLFNENIDNDENSDVKDKQINSIAKAEDSDFVDFSSAFDGDDEEDAGLEEYEEEYEEPRSVASLIKGLPFFKRKKDSYESSSTDETEAEETEGAVQPVKEEKDELKPQIEENLEDSIVDAEENEEIVEEEKPKKEKKFKGFSFFAKKEKETETSVEDEPETEDVLEEQPIQEESANEIIETADETEEAAEELAEEKVEDETVETEIAVGEQKPEKKKFAGFAFFKKTHKETPVQTEEIVAETVAQEEIVEETTEKAEIEILPSFEESAPVVEKSVEESTQVQKENFEEFEPVPEKTKESEEAIEEIPPFELVEEEKTEETFEENSSLESEIDETVAKTPVEEPTSKKKKEKKQKVSKEEKKAKKVKESTDEQNEKAPVETLTMKDHLTFILIILALLLTIVFIVVKFIPLGNNGVQNTGEVTETKVDVSAIQLQREGATGYFIQSDIENVFYVYSAEYNLAYYQCDNNRMSQIQPAGTVNATVTLGQDNLPVKIDYIQMNGQIFGTGIFSAKNTEGNYLHSVAVFKLVNLPKGYEQEGKALLLATTNEEAISQRCNVWTDSYVVDLATGKTTRFLTSDNNIFSTGYSILTDEGYASTNGNIPFLTTREYDAVTNKKDIYLKDGRNETSFATDVAGNFVYADGEAVCYLKATDNGFNVIRKVNGKENIIFSLRSDTSYMYYNEYLLDKYNGILYNVKTSEKVTVSGYGMANAEMMAIGKDGRYLVVLGTVNSALDYQVHIFDLKTNNCGKYVDDNFSQHENLAFVDNKTIVYSAVDPKQGYEYVMLDISKAVK